MDLITFLPKTVTSPAIPNKLHLKRLFVFVFLFQLLHFISCHHLVWHHVLVCKEALLSPNRSAVPDLFLNIIFSGQEHISTSTCRYETQEFWVHLQKHVQLYQSYPKSLPLLWLFFFSVTIFLVLTQKDDVPINPAYKAVIGIVKDHNSRPRYFFQHKNG